MDPAAMLELGSTEGTSTKWAAISRTAPSYRTTGGTSTSTASHCGSPQYKTPPEVPTGDPCPEDPPIGGEPMGEDCPSEPYVEPREIHIYPGG